MPWYNHHWTENVSQIRYRLKADNLLVAEVLRCY